MRYLQTDCVKAQDFYHWMKLLPSAYFTFLIDCEQSFITAFGGHHMADTVHIVRAQWRVLTGLSLTTVVHYLEPDCSCSLTERGARGVVGRLTESFNFALSHSVLHEQKGWTRRLLSHRLFNEAVSFYWHMRGRLDKMFLPAVGVSRLCWGQWIVLGSVECVGVS